MEKSVSLRIYEDMVSSRILDDLENTLVRSGQSSFFISSSGHEASAALGPLLIAEDWLHCHYRDKALAHSRGVAPISVLTAALSKANSNSAGRRMPGFPSDPSLNVLSTPTVVGSSPLQSVGVAQQIKDDPKRPLVVCSVGEGGTQQGESMEAIAEAVRSTLPVLFLIEDNKYALSTPTKGTTFYSTPAGEQGEFLGCKIHRINGGDPSAAYNLFKDVTLMIREQRGPQIVVMQVERLDSHTSSDDHSVYRTESELKRCRKADPITNFRRELIADGISETELNAIDTRVRGSFEKLLAQAKEEADPDPAVACDVRRPLPEDLLPGSKEYRGNDEKSLTLLDAMRQSLKHHLSSDGAVTVYGEDIEDPKGDVFGLTRGLSNEFPQRVNNSPLAESTIIGTSLGRALAGGRPVACLQFADFMAMGYNQLYSELGTMYWRSNGDWNAPVLIMAPCGAYRPGLGPFHAQTPTAITASIPGIDVFVPSNAADAAGLLNAAMRSGRPSIYFYPKSLLNDRTRMTSDDVAEHIVAIGQARVDQEGNDLTLVSWGSTMPICEQVAAFLKEQEVSVELIDLRTISPWDRDTVLASATKTGKLIVVHEENEICGMGGEIVSTVAEHCPEVRVARIARSNTYVPYDYASQLHVLPTFKDVLEKAAEMLGAELSWEKGVSSEGGMLILNAVGPSPSDQNVKVAQLMVEIGDKVTEGTALAAVEADKADMEILAPCAGTIREILLEDGDEIDVGTPFFRIEPAEGSEAALVSEDDPGNAIWEIAASKANSKAAAASSTIYLSSISTVTGEVVRTNEDLLKECPGWTCDDVFKRTGIRSRRWMSGNETLVGMAVRACEKLFAEESIEIGDIDAIVCSTGTPHCVTPSLACRILHQLSGDQQLLIQAHDVNAACSGYLYALQQCCDMLGTGLHSRILLITAEGLSSILNKEDPETYFLFGDAATASLITTESGKGNINAIVKRPVLSSLGTDEKILYVPSTQSSEFLRMDGRPVFRLAVQQMINMLKQACAASDITADDLSIIVPHQANARIIQSIRKTMGVSEEKVFNMIDDHGNTSSNTIPLALEKLTQERGKVDRIGLTAFGGGFTFGAAILNP